MGYERIIGLMKNNGISFESGLTETEINRIEEIYDLSFPASLSAFYMQGLPTGDRFIKWLVQIQYGTEKILKIICIMNSYVNIIISAKKYHTLHFGVK